MPDDKIINLTIDEITWWIIKHCDDEDAMDKINRMTFVYTQKFKN